MNCRNCDKTDGVCYTSYPPQIRCTVTGRFQSPDHPCDYEKRNSVEMESLLDELEIYSRILLPDTSDYKDKDYEWIKEKREIAQHIFDIVNKYKRSELYNHNSFEYSEQWSIGKDC